MRSNKKSSYVRSKVQPLLLLDTTSGGRNSGNYLANGSATDGNEGEYTMGIMVGGGGTCEGRYSITGEHHNNHGGKQANAARQGHQATGSYRFREEGVGVVGQIEQRVGDDVSEGTHQTYRQTISGGRTHILRSRATMLGRIGGTINPAKVKTREGSHGDRM